MLTLDKTDLMMVDDMRCRVPLTWNDSRENFEAALDQKRLIFS